MIGDQRREPRYGGQGLNTPSFTAAVRQALRDSRIGSYFPRASIPREAIRNAPWGVLGYAKVEANQSGITTEVDLAGLTVDVRVGAGRLIRVTGHGVISRTIADGITIGSIKEGTTELGRFSQHNPSAATEFDLAMGFVILMPTEGAHTYKLTLQRFSGSGTVALSAGTTSPAFILVEDLGPRES